MKKFSYQATTLLCSFFLLMSCGPHTSQQTDRTLVGSDKDEHGCIASAGYCWSKLLNECIRPFEKGTRLNPTDEKQSLAAYLVFNTDSTKVEVFLSGKEERPILQREKALTGETIWIDQNNGNLSVRCIKNIWGIYINDQLHFVK